MKDFERETRYEVFKLSDIEYVRHLELCGLANSDIYSLISELTELTNAARSMLDKDSLEVVIVESDWPEYEQVWKDIEDRVVTGNTI